MDTNHADKLKLLLAGQMVKCPACETGYYNALNEDYKNCSHFKCNKCGHMLTATKKLVL